MVVVMDGADENVAVKVIMDAAIGMTRTFMMTFLKR